jgi:hypothetical protein
MSYLKIVILTAIFTLIFISCKNKDCSNNVQEKATEKLTPIKTYEVDYGYIYVYVIGADTLYVSKSKISNITITK